MTPLPGAGLTLGLERVEFPPAGRVTDDTSVLTLKSLVMEPLCSWHDGAIGPGLLDRWEHDAGGRRWRFQVRTDACFHDGKPCTAHDVLDFIGQMVRARDSFGMPWSYARYFAETRCTAESDRILLVESPLAFGDIPDIFSDFHLARANAAGDAVIGTGPYRVVAYERHRLAQLVSVSDRAAAVRLSVLAIPEAERRLQLVRGGRIDIAANLERMHEKPDFADDLAWGQSVNAVSVIAYLNAAQGLFRDPDARLAANLAIDKTALIADVYGGLAVPASTVVSPFHLGFSAAGVTPIAFDPERARRLLDHGVGEGALILRTPLEMPERSPLIALHIKHGLEAVGLPVIIESQADRPAYAREIGQKQMGDLAIFDSTPHSTFRVLHDKISSAVEGIWWQGHDDPLLESMIDGARKSLGNEAREAAYGRCLARLNSLPPWLYLVHPIDVFAARKSLPGCWLDHKGVLHLPAAGT